MYLVYSYRLFCIVVCMFKFYLVYVSHFINSRTAEECYTCCVVG